MATKAIQMQADPRSELGSRQNRKLRLTGKIPGVVYGHKEAVVPVTLPKKELSTHLARGAHVFDLSLDGKSETVLVKEVQYDHLGIEVLHVDFARVSLTEKVTVTVPLELKGTPKGEEQGGVLSQTVSDLEVECTVTDIPDVIRHNVSDMALDDVLHLKDIKLPAGVTALQDEDLVIANVSEVKEEEETTDTDVEPEVIGTEPAAEPAAE
ncbi:MAG: ctc [Phycisphaerales bacterium]|nr:ctc [Phycisphaerales bacterium]